MNEITMDEAWQPAPAGATGGSERGASSIEGAAQIDSDGAILLVLLPR
jgi:hypothetical protein